MSWLFTSKPPVVHENYLRTASPNERRCIARESLDFYRALLIGGIYVFGSPVDTSSIATFIPAVRQCIDRHAHLNITVIEAETESPSFHFCQRLDLSHHVQILNVDESDVTQEREDQIMERILPQILDSKWPSGLPPWKVVVIPFSKTRCFISFSFSHSLADGTSGLAFHNTFINALQQQEFGFQNQAKDTVIYTPKKPTLSPPFDTAQNLPISWSFLLAPLLSTFLPSSLGFRSHIDPITSKTWTGSPIFHSPETFKTNVRVLSIDAVAVDRALKACRANGVKLTGLIHQFIVAALFKSLPESENYDNLVAQTAIDIRQLVNTSKQEMGLYVSGEKQVLKAPQKTGPVAGELWEASKLTTQKLAAAANRRQDHVVGLLRYLNNMHSWMKAKIGERRDSSYEVSNLLSFRPQPPSSVSGPGCSVVGMVFAQPADATGAPLSFNIVSVANGPLVITVTWQAGALDVEPKISEVEFVGKICEDINGSFDNLG
ncbi:hypothetical protein PISL3812_06535 [Talaromyces islandicus]|uniref:Alcohol acetyltransferase n=1 Tax=Talaromyces islandicus TaxID=28573 RepID=A0A0U1M1U0_TALIS|nr:hypothetical protein PISL3812_06535 [Talaromyces islandicus]